MALMVWKYNKTAVVSTNSFNVKTAVADYNSLPHSYQFTGSGVINGVSVSITGSGDLSVLSSGSFEGQLALQQTQKLALNVTAHGSTSPLTGAGTNYFLPADYSELGTVTVSKYEVVDNPPTYPTAAKVGDSGLTKTTKTYSDSSKTNLIGSSSHSYRIEADTADSVLVRFVEVATVTSPASTATENEIYRLDSLGTLTLVSDEIALPGGTVKINVVQ